MQLKCKSYPAHMRVPERDCMYLRLGATGNEVADNLFRVLVMATDWIPTDKAKSFTIYDFRWTDYHGNESLIPTRWSHFNVKYFSTEHEGMFLVSDYMAHTYIGKYYDGKPTHDIMVRPIGNLARELKELDK